MAVGLRFGSPKVGHEVGGLLRLVRPPVDVVKHCQVHRGVHVGPFVTEGIDTCVGYPLCELTRFHALL